MKTAIIVALALAGCSVTVERELEGRNATNKPGIVFIDPDAPYRAAVWAQETYEARYKLDPVRLAKVRDQIAVRRAMEFRSHEIEVQAAALVYGVDPAAYRRKEAASMQRGYDGMFKGMTVDQIVAGMERYSVRAAAWVEDNERAIRRQL